MTVTDEQVFYANIEKMSQKKYYRNVTYGNLYSIMILLL